MQKLNWFCGCSKLKKWGYVLGLGTRVGQHYRDSLFRSQYPLPPSVCSQWLATLCPRTLCRENASKSIDYTTEWVATELLIIRNIVHVVCWWYSIDCSYSWICCMLMAEYWLTYAARLLKTVRSNRTADVNTVPPWRPLPTFTIKVRATPRNTER